MRDVHGEPSRKSVEEAIHASTGDGGVHYEEDG